MENRGEVALVEKAAKALQVNPLFKVMVGLFFKINNSESGKVG